MICSHFDSALRVHKLQCEAVTMGTLKQKLLAPARWSTGSYIREWRRRAAETPYTAVLCYHRVTAIEDSKLLNIERGLPAAVFERQMRFMLRYFEPVKPCDALRPSRSPMRFAVSFDDGTEDNYTIAAPILERLGLSAAFYVVHDFVGTDRHFWWEELSAMLRSSKRVSLRLADCMDEAHLAKEGSAHPSSLSLSTTTDKAKAHENISTVLRMLPHRTLPRTLELISEALGVPRMPEGRDFPLMGWSHLRDLERRGFEIGSHTATHCNLALADFEEIEAEVVKATRAIEAKIDRAVRSFAFPYGGPEHFSLQAAEAMQRSTNVTIAFGGGPGVASAKANPLNQSRVALNRMNACVWSYNLNQAVHASAART